MATTKRNVIPGTIFDTDLTGLYQAEKGVVILGKTLRYRLPNMPVYGLVQTFLVTVIKNLVATPAEQEALTSDQVYNKVAEYLKSIGEVTEDEKLMDQRNIAMGKMFLNPEANKLLMEAIRLSFPDITDPEALTDDAFVELVGFILKQMPE